MTFSRLLRLLFSGAAIGVLCVYILGAQLPPAGAPINAAGKMTPPSKTRELVDQLRQQWAQVYDSLAPEKVLGEGLVSKVRIPAGAGVGVTMAGLVVLLLLIGRGISWADRKSKQ